MSKQLNLIFWAVFFFRFFDTHNFFKKSGVGFLFHLKIFDHRKFKNFVQKSTSEKSKSPKFGSRTT